MKGGADVDRQGFLSRRIHRMSGGDGQKERTLWGTLGSCTGIGVNLLLFGLKLTVSLLSGSVAASADAVNNLSDAAGSIMSLLSVRLAAKRETDKNPFGFGRLEYIGALGVGVLIFFMAFELLKGGITSVLHPELPVFTWFTFAMMAFGIPAKLGLYAIYKAIGKKTDSAVMTAAAIDSRNDCLATSAVLISMLAGRFLGIAIDGWMGIAVSLLVFKSGYDVVSDTIGSLLGGKTDFELGGRILQKVRSYPYVIDVHDFVLHDYGPGRCMASIHVEVPSTGDLLAMHDVIDRMEHEIEAEFGVPICVHMDPVAVTPCAERDAEEQLHSFLQHYTPPMHLHDFRMTGEKDGKLLSFDVDMPPSFRDEETVRAAICEKARQIDPSYRCNIHFDKEYYHV